MDELAAAIEAWEFFRDKVRSLATASTKALLRTCMGIWGDAGEDGYGPTAKKRGMDVYKSVWGASSKTLKLEPAKWVVYGSFLLWPRLACRMILR